MNTPDANLFPIMYLLIFDIFARTIGRLPPEAILKALGLESKLLEYDPENHRLYLSEDAHSIFCFRRFVRGVKLGKTVTGYKSLPAEHVKIYRETVVRLIQANELPPSALKQFENAFSTAS